MGFVLLTEKQYFLREKSPYSASRKQLDTTEERRVLQAWIIEYVLSFECLWTIICTLITYTSGN